MKKYIAAAAILGSALMLPAAAGAQELAVQIGSPGWSDATVQPAQWYGGWRWRHHHHHRPFWWRHRAYAGPCRVIVRRHINRWGERVIVRRRVCY